VIILHLYQILRCGIFTFLHTKAFRISAEHKIPLFDLS
jgi:hypothetical protein